MNNRLPSATTLPAGTEGVGGFVKADEQPLSRREIMAFAALAAGGFMAVLDFFIVLVALPSIRTHTGSTEGQLQLIIAGYAIANAAGLLAAGKLGDALGRKRMFMFGMFAFCLASAACALAQTGTQLVATRIVQGGSAALLMPQVMALLSNSFSGATRLRLFGYYAIA